jgi:hypothetical protein
MGAVLPQPLLPRRRTASARLCRRGRRRREGDDHGQSRLRLGPSANHAADQGADVTSVFWFWFTDDQKGVLFSEGNFIDTVVDHDLQVIDYEYFEQNASDNVNANSFEDPCKVDECTSKPSPRFIRHARF